MASQDWLDKDFYKILERSIESSLARITQIQIPGMPKQRQSSKMSLRPIRFSVIPNSEKNTMR
jgi:hypothetical protein